MSLQDDYAANLLWLDSDYSTIVDLSAPGISRGTCSTSLSVPTTIEASSPNAYIVYSNIKVRPINSTFSAGNVNKDNDYS